MLGEEFNLGGNRAAPLEDYKKIKNIQTHGVGKEKERCRRG